MSFERLPFVFLCYRESLTIMELSLDQYVSSQLKVTDSSFGEWTREDDCYELARIEINIWRGFFADVFLYLKWSNSL